MAGLGLSRTQPGHGDRCPLPAIAFISHWPPPFRSPAPPTTMQVFGFIWGPKEGTLSLGNTLFPGLTASAGTPSPFWEKRVLSRVWTLNLG